jgi:hypothetical protein
MLEQAHAPALKGGGDLVVGGPFGAIQSARFVLSSVLGARDLAPRIAAASPSKEARLFLIGSDGPIALSAHAGIPSLEKAIGDPEVASIEAWADTPADVRWANPPAGAVLRAMDRFHPIPDVPELASSWAEWLYFNARSRDGRLRLYLTFLVGARGSAPGRRMAGVRLQLDRDGQVSNYSARGEVDEALLLSDAPDLDIAGNRVRLENDRYHMTLALGDLSGELVLDPARGQSMPPVTIRGAKGWVSGYTVPALAGSMRGTLTIGRETLSLSDASGYHDHNWGFWKGVRWQWGQVAHDDVSIVFGRLFPPADVADLTRIPGFLAVLGRDGPLGFSTDATIDDSRAGHVEVTAGGRTLDLRLSFTVESSVRSAMTMTQLPDSQPMNFVQLGGVYHVTGRIGERAVDFSERGAAETFEPR